jgi:transmembrane sensor
MSPSNEQIRAAIAEQASEWYVENRSDALSREESAQFMVWLRTSPVHVEEYLRIATLVPDLETASKTVDIALDPLLDRARNEPDDVVALDPVGRRVAVRQDRRRDWRVGPMAAAAVLLFVAAGALWWMRDGERFGLPRSYATAHGEQRVQQLPDGSVLHLNTDSEVTVQYSRTERIIRLEHGQALFEVAKQAQRPFRVEAGQAGVIAVGTEFDVYRKSSAVTVKVLEGTVAVFRGGVPPLPATGLPESAVRLVAGYQIDIDREIGAPRPINFQAASAWLRRQIAFENEPLGEVADEFNRYGKIPIEIEDNALRALPITGVFDAYDTDSFASFLAVLNGVVVQRMPNRIRVFTQATVNQEPKPLSREE